MDNQDGGVSVLVPSWLEAIQNCNNSSSSVGSGLNSENSKTMAADSGQDQGSDTSPSVSNNPQDSIETKKESDESTSNEKKRKILQPEEKAKIKKLKPEPEEGDGDLSQANSGSTHNTLLDIEPFELKAESDSFKCEFSSYKTNSLEEKPSQSDVTNYETSTYLPPRSCSSETGCDNSVVKIKTDDEVKTENELPVVKEEEQAKAASVSSSQDSQANAENEDSASTRTVKEEEEAPTDEQAKEEPTSQSEKKGVKKGDKKTVKTEKKVKEEKKNDESSDDDEGDDKKNGKTKKSGKRRRNIREILTDDKLEARTIVAQKEEMERRKRLQEIQMRAQQEMLFKQQLQQRFMLQQQEQQQHQQQQWVEQQRAQAAAVAASCQQSLQPSISILPIPPKPVVPKVGEEVIEVKSSSSSTTTSSSSSSSADESDESSENESKRHLKKLPFKKNKKDVIDITSSSDNDDVVTVSDHSEPEEEEESDPNNSGSHTNDEFNQPDAQGRVLVNVGHPPEEPDIFLVPQCARMAKPHQIGGIRFLYDNVIESVERFKASCGFGCILAHSMGLGKTFQIVSFVDIFLRITGGKSALIIVPINTIQNWVCEFNMWIPLPEDVPSQLLESGEVQPRNFQIYVCGESLKTHEARAKVLTEWSKLGGVLLIGYEMYRMLALCKNLATKPKKKKGRQDLNLSTDPESEKQNKELLEAIQQALVRPGPDLVICDEGHRIKNSHASTSQALKNIRTKRRIVLTGYPLQNNLIEYWCMVDFVRPNYLGTRAEFSNMFERPIQNGQCLDSTPQDVRLMRFRAHVLHSLLEGFVQRRGHSVLQLTLPRKDEHVLLIRMTPIQRQLYRTFMQELLQRNSVSNPIRAFAMCCKIWNHPDIMYNCLRDLKDDEDLDIEEVTNTKTGETIQNKTKPSSSKAPPQDDQEVTITPLPTRNDNALTYEWANLLMKDYQPGILENSLKMLLMFVIVEQSLAVGDRILLFSQSLFTLTIIEEFLGKHNVPGRFNERWAKGKSYFRLDGGTSAMEREKLITEFNNNPNIHLFLISTRAGSLGINLVGANRVIVFDASWNPCHDTQAMCRVYRYGQVKPCFVYRLVTDNSLEKKIYDRQVNKQGMADRVVDELNPDANLTTKDINNLICVNEEDPGPKDLAFAAEKYSDNVLQHICQHFSHCITKEPFEHESLLIDRKDKKLTKSEKRLARQSYEMEKRSNCNFNRSNYSQRPYGPFGTKFEGGAYGNYANRYGATNVRPSQSTPVPMHPRGLGANYSQEALARQGIFYQQVTVQNEVVIPTSTGDGPPIRIPAGQQVLVVKSPRGIYIRTQDNKIIAIRNPAAVTGGGDVTAAVGTGANNSTTSSVTITPINSSSVSSAGTNLLTGASLLSAANNAKQANIAAKNKGIVISSSLPTQKNISLQSQASQLSASNASKKPLGNKDPEIIDLCDADDEEDVLVSSSQPVTSKAVSSSPSGNFYASYTGTSNCSAYSSPHGNRVSSCNPNLLAGGSLYGAGVGPLASPTAAATTTTTTTTTSSSSLPSSTSSKCTASPPATTTVSSSSNSSVMSSVGNMSAGVNSNKNSGNNTPYNSSYSSNSGIPYTSSNTDNCATSYNNNSNNGNNNNSSNFFSNKDNNVPYTNRSSNNSSTNNPVSYASNNAGNTPYNNSNSSSIPYSIATNSGTSSYSNSSSAPYNSSNANIPYGGNDTSNTSSSVPYGNNSTNQYSNHNPSYNTMPSSSTQNTPIGNLNQSLMGLGIGNAAASNNTPMPPHLSGNCNMGTRPPLGPPMNSMGAMNNMAPNLNSSVPSMSGMNPIHGASHNGPMDSNPDSSFSISQLLASNSMQPPSGSSLASGGLPVSAMDYLNQTLSTMPGEQGPTSGISQLSFLNSIPGLLPPGNQHHPSSMHSSSSQSPYSPGCSSGPMGPPSQMFTAGPLAVHHLGSLYSHLMSPNQLLPGYREDKPPPPPPQHMHMGDGGLSLSKYDFHSNRHRAGQ